MILSQSLDNIKANLAEMKGTNVFGSYHPRENAIPTLFQTQLFTGWVPE